MDKFQDEFKKLNLFQKSFFILVVLGLIFYGSWHVGFVKFPQARAQDCSKYTDTKTLEVKIQNRSFTPSHVEAAVCDYIKFINLSDEPAEPAVGPHPHHTAYPGFESPSVLLKNDQFIFQLNRRGFYSFHNHLHEATVGSVNVMKVIP